MGSAVPEELGEDLAMMARVVQSQLSTALTAFFRRDTQLADKVIERDDQVDNLLGLIEETCFTPAADETRARQQRGIFRVALNLEKLGDYAVNIAEQATFVARFSMRMQPFDLAGAARVALAALDEVIHSFTDASSEKAKAACRCEPELDRRYREALDDAFRRLGQPGADAQYVITHLFVAKFLERIGDSILNIGETTLFILTGERLKLHQYLHLEEMVETLAPSPDARMDVRQIWGGISGARIGRLSVGEGTPLIWKEGAERKIEEEIREIEEWNRVAPGLAPDLKGRLVRDGRESFVREYLDGTLLRDIYLARPWAEKERVTGRLLETVRDIWLNTARREAPAIEYARQIDDRLPELYAVHPRLRALRGSDTKVFGIGHDSLASLLERVSRMETSIAPPVSVRIHGDFNTNNVIYDAHLDRVRFIDVHRSGPGDYLQDIGVFMVSNLRNPIGDPALIADLDRVNRLVADFAAEFARRVGDEHFAVRLLLSQARSLITSARLVTDPEFARNLYLRGVRELEKGVGAAV